MATETPAQTLTPDQRTKSIRRSAKKQTLVKYALENPYKYTWPAISDELSAAVLVKISEKVKESSSLFEKEHVAFGLKTVIRRLENGELAMAFVCKSVDTFLSEQVLQLCLSRRCPAALLHRYAEDTLPVFRKRKGRHSAFGFTKNEEVSDLVIELSDMIPPLVSPLSSAVKTEDGVDIAMQPVPIDSSTETSNDRNTNVDTKGSDAQPSAPGQTCDKMYDTTTICLEKPNFYIYKKHRGGRDLVENADFISIQTDSEEDEAIYLEDIAAYKLQKLTGIHHPEVPTQHVRTDSKPVERQHNVRYYKMDLKKCVKNESQKRKIKGK